MKSEATVFYVVDNSVLHLYLAELSIQSLRRCNRRIPVRVFLFGVKSPATRRRLERCGAEVVVLPKRKDILPMFLKWSVLDLVQAERALYVDADTWFFDDPQKLLELHRTRDFYAREEFGTRPGVGFQLLGSCVMEPQIHPKKLQAISLLLGFKRLPVFNNGVMIFNHGFAARMAKRWGEMWELHELFRKKPGYYPAENLHIEDEVISSIVFGKLDGFSCGKIRKEISPWYCEWKAKAVSNPGIVMHSWTKYSPFFVREFAGARAAARLPFLIPVEESYAEY